MWKPFSTMKPKQRRDVADNVCTLIVGPSQVTADVNPVKATKYGQPNTELTDCIVLQIKATSMDSPYTVLIDCLQPTHNVFFTNCTLTNGTHEQNT